MPNTAYAAPNDLNYMIGKGILTIAELNATTGLPGTYTDLGNCPKFEFETNEQAVTHTSSRYKVKEEDGETVIMVGYNLNFTLDEMAVSNMKLFLRGSLTGTNVIHANTDLAKRYALKFTSDNSAGPDAVWLFHKAKLTPNGSLSLIGDEYSAMSFTAKGLADRTNNPTSPFFDVTFATTTV